jgi:hypothetical protein
MLPMPAEKRAKVDRKAGQYRQRAQRFEYWREHGVRSPRGSKPVACSRRTA